MNAPTKSPDTEEPTVWPVYEVNGEGSAFLAPEVPNLTGVIVQDVNRATVRGKHLVLEMEGSSTGRVVLTGRTKIKQHICGREDFVHYKDLFGHDVYCHEKRAKPPLRFSDIGNRIRNMLFAYKKG